MSQRVANSLQIIASTNYSIDIGQHESLIPCYVEFFFELQQYLPGSMVGLAQRTTAPNKAKLPAAGVASSHDDGQNLWIIRSDQIQQHLLGIRLTFPLFDHFSSLNARA